MVFIALRLYSLKVFVKYYLMPLSLDFGPFKRVKPTEDYIKNAPNQLNVMISREI